MKILLLAGTGAIGKPLIELLNLAGDEVHVTSRSAHTDYGNVKFHIGNAHDEQFISSILAMNNIDCIVDFMIYDTCSEFERIFNKYTDSVGRYVFLSSCRVFDSKSGDICEKDSRLLDSIKDLQYLSTGNYALQKAREENIMIQSSKKNWTIVRPYITFNNKRFQLGILEKEWWLYRALNGHSIVISKDILEKRTTLTYGGDVAKCIAKLIHSDSFYAESLNLTNSVSFKWGEILEVYLDGIEQCTGYRPKVKMIENSEEVSRILDCPYQYIYDRLFDRTFDNHKCMQLMGTEKFTDVVSSLKVCLEDFIKNSQDFSKKPINWDLEKYHNDLADESSLDYLPIYPI